MVFQINKRYMLISMVDLRLTNLNKKENHLVATNDQESGVIRMENTRMKLVSTGIKFMNAFTSGQ